MKSNVVRWVVLAHLAVVMALLTAHLIRGCPRRPDPGAQGMTAVVQLEADPAILPRPREVEELPADRRPEPEPQPEPQPQPQPEKTPAPEPQPEPEPEKPKWRPKSPEEIRKSARRVRKDPPLTQPRPRIDADDLEKKLSKAVTGAATRGQTEVPASYFNRVGLIMRRAWNQPGGAAARNAGVAEVRFRVRRDGTIVSRELVGSSGSGVVDASVIAAARSVSSFPPVPASVRGSGVIDFTIEFKLE
ncbi:energy transducer TonB [Kiritimatiella glycovorans]|uniref:Transport protein TonB n=1 Tax=Kiritimatiella glycovorans TaxID=1307763 RepID=A0A0G3EAR7_9BACT|nr:energy transducer TonB [Kiritimatiella glycovorans]AKJ63348.1 transport protein TonB [Kiritimatiella glycovorans]